MASTDPWVKLGRRYEDCLARCSHPEYTLLVASEDGVRLGLAVLHPRGVAGSPYITAIAVEAGVRGRGIGSALLERAEAHFAGARHIFLCVSSFNPRARMLYERRGYRAVGEFADYVIDGASETLMHKRLAPK